jgi:nitrite reductase/ring-hydroxylating ferredoxin subunit
MTQDAFPAADPADSPAVLTRRATLPLVAATVGSGLLLAACGSNTTSPSVPGQTTGAATPPPATTAGQATATSTTSPTGAQLAALSAVPTGGGLVLHDQKIVLTRESSGTVHGFSAICTHEGCLVGTVAGGQIMCPCHGSRFNATTGAVEHGPAMRPLPTVPVTVRGDGIYQS